MVGYMGINRLYKKLRKRTTKERMMGPRWNSEAESACFSSLDAFKTG
jgi:hypothetical protein